MRPRESLDVLKKFYSFKEIAHLPKLRGGGAAASPDPPSPTPMSGSYDAHESPPVDGSLARIGHSTHDHH